MNLDHIAIMTLDTIVFFRTIDGIGWPAEIITRDVA
jgi:hypothetical protein